MEEILSSIKRIIAEEGDGTAAPRARRSPRAPVKLPDPIDGDEVLELSEPVPEPQRIRQPARAAGGEPLAPVVSAPVAEEAPVTPQQPAEPIVSPRAAEASRGSLEALSRMIVKPDVQGSDTLEGLVREMLKPMLREWLDANLPQLVETMVAREIARITRGN